MFLEFGEKSYWGVSIIPITFRSDWSYFINFRVIALIKSISAIMTQSSKNIRVKSFRLKNFRVIGLIAVIPAQFFFSSDWSKAKR